MGRLTFKSRAQRHYWSFGCWLGGGGEGRESPDCSDKTLEESTVCSKSNGSELPAHLRHGKTQPFKY